MARARNIKPGFYKNEDLAECTPWARLLFPGLWMLSDREGRLENRPKRIKGEIFPFDSVDVQALLDELESWKFIKRYEVCGVKCIQIVNFTQHQSPHGTEKDSELPCENGFLTINERNKGAFVTGKFNAVPYGEPLNSGIEVGSSPSNNDAPTVKAPLNNGIEVGSSPSNNDAPTVKAPLDTGATTVNPPLDNALNPDSLNPDSLNPDSLNPDSLNPEKEKAPRKRRDSTLLVGCPDDVDPQIWQDWHKLRSAKRAPVTDTVVAGARAEAAKAAMTLEDFLSVWCRRGSQGLEASWLKPEERINGKTNARPKVYHDISGMDYTKGVTDDGRF